MSIIQERVKVNGEIYLLQHPGARAWLRLRGEMLEIKDSGATMNTEKLLDYSFENVIFHEPLQGRPVRKLNLDTMHPKEAEVWSTLLPRFFRGDIEALADYRFIPGPAAVPEEPVQPQQSQEPGQAAKP